MTTHVKSGIGRAENFGLVDEIDADGLQHLRLDKVAYSRLGHDLRAYTYLAAHSQSGRKSSREW